MAITLLEFMTSKSKAFPFWANLLMYLFTQTKFGRGVKNLAVCTEIGGVTLMIHSS